MLYAMEEQREALHHKEQAEQAFTRIYGAQAQRHRPLLAYQLGSIALLFQTITDAMQIKAGRSLNQVPSRCKVSTRISFVTDSHREASSHKQVVELHRIVIHGRMD